MIQPEVILALLSWHAAWMSEIWVYLSMWLPYKRVRMTVQPISINLLYFITCLALLLYTVRVKARQKTCRAKYFMFQAGRTRMLFDNCSSSQKHWNQFAFFQLRVANAPINTFIKSKFIRPCIYLPKLWGFSFCICITLRTSWMLFLSGKLMGRKFSCPPKQIKWPL